MFAFLWRFGGRPHRIGQPFALFMAFYAVERFFIEFVRAKSDRLMLGLSTSQIASIVLLAIATFILVRYRGPKVDPSRGLKPARQPAR
jgi:prolipoprotein diacylglyceryltransferase